MLISGDELKHSRGQTAKKKGLLLHGSDKGRRLLV